MRSFIGLLAGLFIIFIFGTLQLRSSLESYIYPLLSASWELAGIAVILSFLIFCKFSRRTINVLLSISLVGWAFVGVASVVYYRYFSTLPGKFAVSYLINERADALSLASSVAWQVALATVLLGSFLVFVRPREISRKARYGSLLLFIGLAPVLYNAYRVQPGTQTPVADLLFSIFSTVSPSSTRVPRLEGRSYNAKFATQGPAPFNTLIVLNESLRYDYSSDFQTDGENFRLISFPNAFSNASYTHLSVPSLLTGISPARDFNDFLNAELLYETLKRNFKIETSIFSSQSYSTGNYEAFLRSPLLDQLVFREKEGWDAYNNVGARDSLAVEKFSRYLEQLKEDQNFFSVLHFNGTHYPYRTEEGPESYALAAREAKDNWSKILSVLKHRDLDKTTLVIIMSDHAEALGERGFQGHFSPLIPETTHVPFFWIVPKGIEFEPEDLSRNVSNLDLVPTLLSMYRLKSLNKLDGNDLLQGESKDIVISNNITGQTFVTFALVDQKDFTSYKLEDRKLFEAKIDRANPKDEVRWESSDCTNLKLVPSFSRMVCLPD